MFGRGSYAIVRRCKSSIFFVAIRSEIEVSASSQTRRCSLEVPLDATRCRYSVHWREGGSARRSRISPEWCTASGAKEGKDGRRRWCHWQRSAFPRRPSFPFPSSGDARHSAADARRRAKSPTTTMRFCPLWRRFISTRIYLAKASTSLLLM